MHYYRKEALAKAKTQLGVKEQPSGSNSGARVQQYQAATSLGGTGWPWCAAFQNWCFREAGRPLVELGRSASVANLLAAAKQHGWTDTVPNIGDLVCYDWDTLAGPGKVIGDEHADHIGIVAKVYSDGSFDAVEGNTAIGNDSNGGEVMLRNRKMSMVEGFIRVPGGYKFLKRYRITRDGKVVGVYRLPGALLKMTSLVKAIAKGEGVYIKRIRIRKEYPKV